MTYIIGSDHAGYAMKESIRFELDRLGHPPIDCGAPSADPVDYPVIARQVTGLVCADPQARGILICGSGVGMSIVANRQPGIRAALCFTEEMAELCRRHNDANILVLPGRYLPLATAWRMVRVWMDTPFDGGRHTRRVALIDP